MSEIPLSESRSRSKTERHRLRAHGGNSLNGIEDFCLKNGSNQGQNLALTVLSESNSLDSGLEAYLFGSPNLSQKEAKNDPPQYSSRGKIFT